MLILDTINKFLQIKTEVPPTKNLEFTVSYSEVKDTNFSQSALRSSNGYINLENCVLIEAPLDGNVKEIKYINIRNQDVIDHNLNLYLKDNLTSSSETDNGFQIYKAIIKSGGTLEWSLMKGWQIYDAQGFQNTKDVGLAAGLGIQSFSTIFTFAALTENILQSIHGFTEVIDIEIYVSDLGVQTKLTSGFDIILDATQNITINKRFSLALIITVKITGKT